MPKVEDDDDDAIAAIVVISGDDDGPEKFCKGFQAARQKKASTYVWLLKRF